MGLVFNIVLCFIKIIIINVITNISNYNLSIIYTKPISALKVLLISNEKIYFISHIVQSLGPLYDQ